MAINYSRTGEPVSPQQQHDWDSFIHEAKRCPKCGRASLLFDRCPSCGGAMSNGKTASVTGYILFFLAALAVLGVFQVFILVLAQYLSPALKTAAIILSILIHAVGVLICSVILIRNRSGMQMIPLGDILRERKTGSRSSRRMLQWSFLNTVHDAYHLDLFVLEETAGQITHGDTQTRDTLLGQAVWLSAICDCPRLALVRFRLLCSAPVTEGMDTDLDSILDQLSSLDAEPFQAAVCTREGIITLSDCLRFGCVDVSPDNLNLCLSILLAYLDNLEEASLQDSGDRRRVIQTLAYFGPEAYQDSLLTNLVQAGITEDLIHFNRDFREILPASL